MGVDGHRHGPAVLPPEKETRHPYYRRFGEPQSLPERMGKIYAPTSAEIRSPNRLAVACHYTGSAIPVRSSGCRKGGIEFYVGSNM